MSWRVCLAQSRAPLAQYLDLGRTYVHWKAGHPQAGADDALEAGAASDASSEEGIDAASQSGEPAPACSTFSTCLQHFPCGTVLMSVTCLTASRVKG